MSSSVSHLIGGRLVLATHNEGKQRELGLLLEPLGISCLSARDLGLPVPVENGTTFAENSSIKALSAARATNCVALADDSGLCVDALFGAPGIYTAEWAGEERDFAKAMARVDTALRQVGALGPAARGARFVSVLSLAWPDGHLQHFSGEVEGEIIFPPQGDEGFGYDACFRPKGYERSFGEMSAEEKHSWAPGKGDGLSHRARAFAALWDRALRSQEL
ncbi:MAG: non-canonical purine NTP pyrophosphatase [Alphaproteobacteria bacterium]|nr:non-canonical purine NTP pyrophosphatase [Alphaproteobacteria bacterium]